MNKNNEIEEEKKGITSSNINDLERQEFYIYTKGFFAEISQVKSM